VKQNLFIRQLGTYFETYLPETRGNSKNTISSYSDAFAILFQFFYDQKGIPHHLVDYKHFTAKLFDDYLLWLKQERKYSEASIKQRVSAISSFLKYASRREMAALSAFSNATNIDTPKIPQSVFPYFTLPEMKILLGLPDPRKRLGDRDMVLLSLLYDTAARVQEVCDLLVRDVRFGTPTKIRLFGKNKKTREIPISSEVSDLLRYHLKTNGLNDPVFRDESLFASQAKDKMTASCIRYMTTKYVSLARQANPKLFNEPKYSPHSFRHSKAVHMVEAGIPLIYIRDFLDHASIETTEIYARVSQAAINNALTNRKIPNIVPKRSNSSLDKQQLPDFLSSAR